MTSLFPILGTAPGDARRRLLLIAYHFPPAGNSGALRWQKLAAHAYARGWGMDVITLAPRDMERLEPERLGDLPPGLRLYGLPAPRPALDRMANEWWARARARWRLADIGAPAAGSLSRAEALAGPRTPRDVVRAFHAWRECGRDACWAQQAARSAGRLMVSGVHQVVVTCGPPHAVHEGGRRLCRRTGLPHVVDMRDPWSLCERLPEPIASPVWYGLAATRERRVVTRAALLVANTEPARWALARAYPEAAGRIVAVPNGCDEAEVAPRAVPRTRFLVAYAGSIYLDRSPASLFAAVAAVARELGLTPAEFGVELMGQVFTSAGRSVAAMAAAYGLADYVRLYPPRPRSDAMRFLATASVLVSLPQDSHLAIPAKIFEYACFAARVLVLAEPGSAAAQVLGGTGADVVHPEDRAGLCAVLRRRFLEWRAGHVPLPLAGHPALSRGVHAARLFDAIERLVPHGPPS